MEDNQGEPAAIIGGGEPTPAQVEIPANQAFLDSLPEGVRGEASLSRLSDVGALANSYLEGQRVISSSIRLPGENATVEDIASFRQKLGMPETADAYDLSIGENIPDAVRPEDSVSDWYRNTAHKHGVSKTAAQDMWSDWQEFNASEYKLAQEEHIRTHNEAEASLKAELGENYTSQTKLADDWFMNNFSEATRKMFSDLQIGDNANFIKDIIALTGKSAGDTVANSVGGDNLPSGVALHDQLRNTTGHPEYWDDSAKGKELQALAQQLSVALSANQA